MRPTLHLSAHDTEQEADLPLWQRKAEAALPLCKAQALSPDAPLLSLEELEFSFVSDKTIARVHEEFMDDPSPTDVITFHHGEILISLDTAALQAAEYNQDYNREVVLYMIHGMLHLAGWNDESYEDERLMSEKQNNILQTIFPQSR